MWVAMYMGSFQIGEAKWYENLEIARKIVKQMNEAVFERDGDQYCEFKILGRWKERQAAEILPKRS